MDKRLKYLPALVIPSLVCGFGSAMTRNTVYRRCRVQKGISASRRMYTMHEWIPREK